MTDLQKKLDALLNGETATVEPIEPVSRQVIVMLYASDKSQARLKAWAKGKGFDTKDLDFHMTLVASANEVATMFDADYKVAEPWKVKATGFEALGPDSDTPVLRVEATPELQLMRQRYVDDHLLQPTFEEFKPHVSLSYNWDGETPSLEGMRPPRFHIELDRVVVKGLDAKKDDAEALEEKANVKRLVWYSGYADPRANDGWNDGFWRLVGGKTTEAADAGSRKKIEASDFDFGKVDDRDVPALANAKTTGFGRGDTGSTSAAHHATIKKFKAQAKQHAKDNNISTRRSREVRATARAEQATRAQRNTRRTAPKDKETEKPAPTRTALEIAKEIADEVAKPIKKPDPKPATVAPDSADKARKMGDNLKEALTGEDIDKARDIAKRASKLSKGDYQSFAVRSGALARLTQSEIRTHQQRVDAVDAMIDKAEKDRAKVKPFTGTDSNIGRSWQTASGQTVRVVGRHSSSGVDQYEIARDGETGNSFIRIQDLDDMIARHTAKKPDSKPATDATSNKDINFALDTAEVRGHKPLREMAVKFGLSDEGGNPDVRKRIEDAIRSGKLKIKDLLAETKRREKESALADLGKILDALPERVSDDVKEKAARAFADVTTGSEFSQLTSDEIVSAAMRGRNKPATDAPKTPEAVGEARRIITPDGSFEFTATPTLIELDDLRAATGKLQPRDRSRAESDAQIRDIASNLDPLQLEPSRTSDRGAPIVDENGTVLSGNGRVEAVRLAYEKFKGSSDKYRSSLGEQARGMKSPVLVMRVEKLSDKDKENLADKSNRQNIASMSVTERAVRDAAAAGPEIMALYQGGDFGASPNQEFLRSFTAKVVTAQERAAFSKDGNLTKEGQARMSASLLASAYGDPESLSVMLESTDDNIRAISGAMQDAAPDFIRLNAEISSGATPKRFEASKFITEAARKMRDLRNSKQKFGNWLDQQDAFDQVSAETEAFMRLFHNDELTRTLSRETMAKRLKAVAIEAAKKTDGGLFEDDTDLKDVIKASTTSRQESLFSDQGGIGGNNGNGGQAREEQQPASRGGQAQGETAKDKEKVAAKPKADAGDKVIDDVGEKIGGARKDQDNARNGGKPKGMKEDGTADHTKIDMRLQYRGNAAQA